jgi:hypothetical protein
VTRGGVTLGHLMIAMAIVEVIAVLWMARSVRPAEPGKEADQRRAMRIIVAASIVTSLLLIAFALLHPLFRMPIL